MAQPAHIHFTSLGIRDGLLSNSVTAILKDRYGLMWFATNDGLNKFDGKNFVIYRHRSGDSTSLRSNEVLALHEDPAGHLWVGTSGGALSEYDRKRDCFIHYPDDHYPGAPKGGMAPNHFLSTALVRGICSDRRGRIWIAQFEAPYVLDPGTGRLTCMDLHPYAADPAQRMSLLNIYEDAQGRIWVATDRGLFQYLSATNTFRQYRHRVGDPTSLLDDVVRVVCEDGRGDLWVGTDKGLCRLLAGQDRFEAFREQPGDGPPATAAQINALTVDKEGYVWAGGADGLVIIDPRTGKSVTYRPDGTNPHSLTSEGISCIYIDPDGIYWVGTIRGGINKYDKNLNLFDGKMGDAFRDGGTQSTVVTGFAQQPDGNLWVATDGGGLYSFDRKTERLQRVPLLVDGRVALPLGILTLQWTSGKKLLIGTFSKGLLSYDPATGRTQRLPTGADPGDMNANSIYCLWEDSAGRIWAGTNGSGVSVLKDGRVQYRLLPNPTRPTDIRLPVNGFIRSIAVDRDGHIWIGSHGDGLAVYDPHTRHFKVYNQENGALPSDKVQAVLRDSRGRMWLGTYGGGLCLYDVSKDKFVAYSEKDGLQNTNVYSVVEDGDGRIWVSTNSGISSLDAQANVFRNFTPYNGLQNNNFVHASALRAADGELFFGGQQGFNYLNPSALTMNRNVPVVLLTDLKVSNKSVVPGKGAPIREQISIAGDIQLDYGQNFALGFVALNYTLPDQNRYAYRLEGFDRDWIYAGGQNTAYYTNLDPGNYVFRVKASNNDGVWSNGDTTIRIHVRPPFWRTVYAYIFYGLLAAGLLFYSRHRGLTRVRKKYAAEQERREIRQAQELDRLKLKFLTNLSHEFRTPIALIMGPVEQMLSEQYGGSYREKLVMVRRNGRRLLNLVNQLLDFRKMEEQELTLQVSPGELVGFVREIGHSFADLGERKRIAFEFATTEERLWLTFDHDKTERILFNLLSNAFKFTREGGSVRLTLDAAAPRPDGLRQVTIRVSDSGIGIPRNQQDRIFERFFQHATPGAILNQGTGIGLSITKEFVHMHGGSIHVDSEPGRGSVFTVSVPMAQADAHTDNESDSMPGLSVGMAMDGGREDAGNAKGRRRTPGAVTAKPLILLVEDNDDFRFYLKDNLRNDYEVLEAANGKEGWQQALAAHPELIVSDISMPYMDGIELTGKLKADKRTSHIPVILLTALAGEAEQLKGLGTGANDYITKPFSFELLSARINGLLQWNCQLRRTYTKQVKVLMPEVDGESGNEKLMKRIVTLLESQVRDPQLSVESLSRELGMSRSSLYGKVLEITGETPVEFIRSFRLQKAAALLENGDLSIAEIAYEVGFSAPNYFTRAFKTKYKILPSDYPGRAGKAKSDAYDNRPQGRPAGPAEPAP
jgi:signal transduction histidine kinase/ligand-binding sensor domain-containing protein/DNA-binding response OmpR family regulator